jgi:hypothetical protein
MISTTRHLSGLDDGLVIAPERYDPRRSLRTPGVPLSEIVVSSRVVVDPARTNPAGEFLVIDTGDADRGSLIPHNHILAGAEVGSAKKVVPVGSVLISRLRPYLRQVTYAHPALFRSGATVVSSSEFVVLVGRERNSIAFLVPWLLSDDVQSALAAGQEGGHHPRIREEMLLGLQVPHSVIQSRETLSETIERAVGQVMDARATIESVVESLSQTDLGTS